MRFGSVQIGMEPEGAESSFFRHMSLYMIAIFDIHRLMKLKIQKTVESTVSCTIYWKHKWAVWSHPSNK